MQDALALLNKTIKDKVFIAKARWAAHLCSKIHNMAMNPRLAWEFIHLFTGGSTVHHKKSVSMAMKMPNGYIATNGKKNMSVFGSHFECVFNSHHPVDLTNLDKIAPCPVLPEINLPISFDKVDAAINKLKNGKSPGLMAYLLKHTKRLTAACIVEFTHELRPSSNTTYPNGTSKEGRASDGNTKKLSVSLTLALAWCITVTRTFRCDTR